MNSGTEADLYGVWGSSAYHAFATGLSGAVSHYKPPIVLSVMPNYGELGITTSVVMTGVNLSEASEVSFGIGISIDTLIVVDSGHILVTITIADNDPSGDRDITVTTPGGTVALPSAFTIISAPPVIASISPALGNQGATLDVTISGRNFTGSSAISFGTGLIINSFSVPNPSQVIVNITISRNAQVGARDVSVTTPGGTSTLIGVFTVKQAPPVIRSVSPNRASQGATLDVTINGSKLNGTSEVSFGSGIMINSLIVLSPIQIKVSITIDGEAAVGSRDILVVTPGGTSTLSAGFAVEEESPNTLLVVLTWLGVGLGVILLGIVARILRRRRVAP